MCGVFIKGLSIVKAAAPDAFAEGEKACHEADGLNCNSDGNPYERGTVEEAAWHAGWNSYWSPKWCDGCEDRDNGCTTYQRGNHEHAI